MDNQRPGNSATWDAAHARVQSNITGTEDRIGENIGPYPSNRNTHINAEERIGDNSFNAEERIGDTNTRNAEYRSGDRQYNYRAETVGDASNWRGGHDVTPNNYIQPHSPRNQLRQSMDRYARENNINRKNIGALAQYHDKYHGHVMGHPANINEQALQNAGFTFKS